jgi:mitochondrial import inner membrane translocase subunit TIM21
VSSQIYMDSTGREHMFLSFYVSSSPSSSAILHESDSYLDVASAWVHSRWDAIQGVSFDEAMEWAKERGEQAWESSRRSLRYLVGQPLSTAITLPEKKSNQHDGENEQDQGVWGKLTGMFGGIKGLRGGTHGDGVDEGVKAADGKVFAEGEVYAELVKVCSGFIASLIGTHTEFFLLPYLE